MELIELQTLQGDFAKLQDRMVKEKPAVDASIFAKQYDPKKHDVMDMTLRKDKNVITDQGTTLVPVTRLPIPLQKKIVRISAAFLCGNPIQLSATPVDQPGKDLLAVLQRTWEDNKLDYQSKSLLKLMMSETECAELWYTEPVDQDYWAGTPAQGAQRRLRIKLLATSFQDTLYPSYSANGDMVAFGRAYPITTEDKVEQHYDVYLSDKTIKGVQAGSGWTTTVEPNPVGKIPVIYYRQTSPEWWDVQELCDRMEKLPSNLADLNDYFGGPMVKVTGKIVGFAAKGETGKVIEIEQGGDAEYLTWDQAPEATRLEYSILRSLIFDMTDTPDISIENMKALGVFSGVALKLLFMGAHMKASDKEEIFGAGVQRRINFLKAALAKIWVPLEKGLTLTIKPKFTYFLPKNDQETVTNLSTATGGKPTMSQKTAVAMNPYVADPEAELEAIKSEGVDAIMDPLNT